MKSLLLITVLLLTGCGKNDTIVQQIPGPQGAMGAQGPAGANGHSIVSQFVSFAQGSLECAAGGTRLDLYLDLDDSLTVTKADKYVGSLIACNGLNGLKGTDGLPGTNGKNGSNGSNGAQGIPGVAGPQGSTGPTGLTGVAGSPGPIGPIGPQGPAGTPGAVGPAGAGAVITGYTSTVCTLIAGTTYYTKANEESGSIFSDKLCSNRVSELKEGNSFWVGPNTLAVFSGLVTKILSFN